MALDQVVNINVNTTAGQAAVEMDKLTASTNEAADATEQLEGANKSLKAQLKEATNEAQILSQKFGENSKEALAAQKKVAALKEEISDFKERVDALNPEAKFKAFGQALGAVAGGFAAAEGAMALFGGESEELQKTMLKVQAALALSQGINELKGLGDALTNVKMIGLDMLKSLRAAIVANPLLAIVTAVAAIGTAVYAWVTAETDLQVEIKKSKEVEEQRMKLAQSSFDRQIKLAKALGQETHALEMAKLADMIKSAKTQLELDKQLERSNLEQAQKRLYVLSLTSSTFKEAYDNITLALDNFDKYSESKFKEQSDSIKNLENDLTISRLDIFKSAVTGADKVIKDTKEKSSEAKREEIKELETVSKKEVEIVADTEHEKLQLKTYTFDQTQVLYEEELTAAERFNAQLKQLSDDLLETLNGNFGKAQEFAIDSVSQNLNTAATFFDAAMNNQLKAAEGNEQKQEEIRKKYFERQKKIQIAQAIISTYEGATNAFKSTAASPITTIFPAAPYIAAASAIVAGLANVSKIRSQSYNGGGGSGGGSSAPSIGGGGGVSAPQINPDNVQSTLLNRNEIESGNTTSAQQQPVKVFVTETDISNTTNRVNSIKQKATII